MSEAVMHPMALAIVQAHAATLALPISETRAAAPDAGLASDVRDNPVYSAALQAAHALGFNAADARCVALAWHRRQQRSGRFDAAQWPVDPLDFGLAPAPHSDAFAPCPRVLGLYAVLPDAGWVGRMARAGVPTLQLRCKSADPRTVRAEVRQAVAALQGTSARLFINDHWREAIDAGAYGVHLGQEDLDQLGAQDLQSIRAAGLRLGLSSHGYAEMLRAAAIRPSYIALGAVFATTLKAMASVPQGLGRLRVYARLMHPCPVVAIGGIDASRLAPVLATGVGAVGMVRALIAADSPEQAAADFSRAIDDATRQEGGAG